MKPVSTEQASVFGQSKRLIFALAQIMKREGVTEKTGACSWKGWETIGAFIVKINLAPQEYVDQLVDMDLEDLHRNSGRIFERYAHAMKGKARGISPWQERLMWERRVDKREKKTAELTMISRRV